LSAALGILATACGKDIVIGSDLPGDASKVADANETSDGRDRDAPQDDATDTGAVMDASEDGGFTPLVVPWTTGFENDDFNDWSEEDGGFCYTLGVATYSIVTTPVHTGKYAAAFKVDPAASSPSQTRCARQGALPASAYYGAWYYVPALETNDGGDWNLFHFQGAESPDAAVKYLWDVSLINQADGAVAPWVYDFVNVQAHTAGPAIPIATWFHLEVRLKRSAVDTGEFTLYLDGNAILDLAGLATDDTNWGQWFVGNYATTLLPSPSTVYVDDVTIETSGP
jgi:hypothetical protein